MFGEIARVGTRQSKSKKGADITHILLCVELGTAI